MLRESETNEEINILISSFKSISRQVSLETKQTIVSNFHITELMRILALYDKSLKKELFLGKRLDKRKNVTK